jgi:hypothetical protein
MATVPGCDQAVVELAKVTDYLMSSSHTIGWAKARFFKRFGFREDEPQKLVEALLAHARDNQVADIAMSAYGTKYRVDGPINSPDGRNPDICTVWMIPFGETTPRFVRASMPHDPDPRHRYPHPRRA